MSRREIISFALVFAGFAVASFVVSPGFFNIDEFTYYAGAQAATAGDLTIDPVRDSFESYQLRLWLLVDGPNGLAPQYPAGTALVGAILLTIFGLPGLILMNALAGAGVVAVTYVIALRHFGGRAIAYGACALLVLATFFLEYAFAVWPHAPAMLAVLAAVLWLLDVLQGEETEKWRMLAIGGTLGLGMAFRTDVAIAVPAIALCIFLWSRRPVARLFWMGLGLAPFILALALVNLYKFGDFNPVSYGQTHGGGTNLQTHLILLLALGTGGLVALGMRWVWFNTPYRKHMLGALIVSTLAVLVAAHGFVLSYLHGFWALIVDATTIEDARPGIERFADGTMTFWGYWKKALGQSMPWIAMLLAAPFVRSGTSGMALRVIVVLSLVWSLPFFPRDWHGGMGANMRYFLPLIPLFCALAASLIAALWEKTPAARRVLPFSVLFGTLLTTLWAILLPTGPAGAHQILPAYLLLASAVLALLAGYLEFDRRGANLALLAFVGLGIGVAFQLAIADFRSSQEGRSLAQDLSAEYAGIPDRSLAFVPSRFLVGWAFEPGHVSALPNDRSGEFDTRLIDAALGQGYRVFIWPRYSNAQLEEDARYELVPSAIGPENARLLELRKATGQR